MALSRAEVVALVGRLDDLKLAEIIATGASAAQITEAKVMLTGGESVASLLGRPPEPVVTRLYEILKSDELDEDDR